MKRHKHHTKHVCTALFWGVFRKLKVEREKTQAKLWAKNSNYWSQLKILSEKSKGKINFQGPTFTRVKVFFDILIANFAKISRFVGKHSKFFHR